LKLRKLLYRFRDVLWATLEPCDEEAKHKHVPAKNLNPDIVKEAYNLMREQLAQEDDRNKAVEGKLQGIISFNSIAVALVTILVAIASNDKASVFPPTCILVIILLGSYVVLQLIRALLAAIDGLERKDFKTLTHEILSPHANETANNYYSRLFDQSISCMEFNQKTINAKVDQMTLAHISLRNAMRGFILVLLAIVFSLLCHYLDC
jgi:hypothetical protein